MNANIKDRTSEQGSAIVIALLVMALLLVFVALAVSRSTSETIATANEAAETRTFSAAQASLENMSQRFDSIFELKLAPNLTDLETVRDSTPDDFDPADTFDKYTFYNTIRQIGDSQPVIVTDDEDLEGLEASRDTWRLTATATDTTNGTQVKLERSVYNYRIPIFQFGIFNDDDMEFYPGPAFNFNGRVHTNGNLYLLGTSGLNFTSKVTAGGQIITDVMRNGNPHLNRDRVYVKDAAGVSQRVRYDMGSALSGNGGGPNVISGGNLMTGPDAADYPAVYRNDNWSNNQLLYGKNLLAGQPEIDLPLRIDNNDADYIDLIKRGKAVGDLFGDGTGSIVPITNTDADNQVVAWSRYANKAGIRVSLSDSKAKLPGCAKSDGSATTNVCGVRLDGEIHGGVDRATNTARPNSNPPSSAARGYEPRAMNGVGGQATRLNGERFFRGDPTDPSSPETWIKIELVSPARGDIQPETTDITEDILSLGITEQAPELCDGLCNNPANYRFRITHPANYYDNDGVDSRSIIKLQRFAMEGGAQIHSPDSNYTSPPFLSHIPIGSKLYNYVKTDGVDADTGTVADAYSGTIAFGGDNADHKKMAIVGAVPPANNIKIVPFPINMFDSREGVYNSGAVSSTGGIYGNYRWLTRRGVMSLVDVDIANLRKFINGEFDAVMPTSTVYAGTPRAAALKGADVPTENGWVLYISDRRGDRDFDGEFDMEDIYGPNDDKCQPGENVNGNKNADGTEKLDVDYQSPSNRYGEAARYTTGGSRNAEATVAADQAAVLDHIYFRRAVRLINGTLLPGKNDIAFPGNTLGFTVASENPVYVLGDYNTTGVNSGAYPVPAASYLPDDTSSDKVPASIAADAITILSNAWADSNSFRHGYNHTLRRASRTYTRFAVIAGDTKSSLSATPNQGGGEPRLQGGVHNFKRLLENWDGLRLNYTGSLINMFYSRQANGAFKSGATPAVYTPAIRDWTFETSFRDVRRLPPATPFLQKIGLSGFKRVND